MTINVDAATKDTTRNTISIFYILSVFYCLMANKRVHYLEDNASPAAVFIKTVKIEGKYGARRLPSTLWDDL